MNRNKVFLYKVKDSDDRDCVAYIDDKPMRFECNHYFGSIVLYGACYCGHTFESYENINTILTRDEYEQLIQFSKEINELGYGINKGDKRYKKGVELCSNIYPIYEKLLSKENDDLFKKVIEEEKEYLLDEYNLDDEDVELIFDNYMLDYRDRGIVGYVFEDTYELGYEEAFSLGYIKNDDSIIERYFDFEKFGEDLLEDEDYLELADGRCVRLNY